MNEAQSDLIIDEETNLTSWEGMCSVEPSFLGVAMRRSNATILATFTGNRSGKTFNWADYVWASILGDLPNERFNMRPHRKIRKYRLASQTLPGESQGELESKNTIYPAIKSIIPPQFIKTDINSRNKTMAICDPQGGPDVYLEYTSYFMADQAGTGVERFFVYLDECPPYSYYGDQRVRLLTAGGRLGIGLTSIDANWTYEEIFERARRVIRSKLVRKGYLIHLNQVKPMVENLESPEDIEVIQTATDENPILPQVLERLKKEDPTAVNMTVDDLINRYINADDPDVIPMKRYGISKQISGAIFKDFSYQVHFRDFKALFPDGIPHYWRHAITCDYHEDNAHTVPWIALSETNEAFIWQEAEYPMDKWTTLPIQQDIAKRNGDYQMDLALADPRMAINQPSLGISVMEDANKILRALNAHMYWQSWDSKSQKGRDEIKKRLANSKICQKPFNNKVLVNGVWQYLPTLWISNECPRVAKSLKNWRYKEPHARNSAVETDMNGEPMQKWSHFCTAIEAVFKHPGFKPKIEVPWEKRRTA